MIIVNAKLSNWYRRVTIRRNHIVYGAAMALLLLLSSFSLINLSPYRPASANQYFRAVVLSVRSVQSPVLGPIRDIRVRLLDGPQKTKDVTIQSVVPAGDAAAKRLPVGSQVLLSKSTVGNNGYGYVSRWYMPGIATLFITLLALVVLVGAWRGITSVFGLAISVFILAAYVVPKIVQGENAFLICVEGAILITLVSIYIAHGFSRRTTVAFVGSLVTLGAIVGLTALASYVTGTSEILTEDNSGILYAAHPLDIAGLLTGGVIIASLGTLFDITTGQAATIDELHKVDRKLTTGQLFWKGMSVGREHIAALINTLALVYVGVALPSIVTTIVLNQEYSYHPPMLVNLNTETIAEEVVRTCVASIGMLLALPITTLLAAYVLPRWAPKLGPAIRRKLMGASV
jgi:uncharacterized membrane protein